MKHCVYIAAPSELAGRADDVGRVLVSRRPDVEIASRWHGTPVEKYPRDASERADKVAMNMSDLLRAQTVVVLADVGVPRSTWVELGVAIGMRKFAILFSGAAPEQSTIFDAHGGVFNVPTYGGISPETAAICISKLIPEATIAHQEAAAAEEAKE